METDIFDVPFYPGCLFLLSSFGTLYTTLAHILAY